MKDEKKVQGRDRNPRRRFWVFKRTPLEFKGDFDIEVVRLEVLLEKKALEFD